jgi:long-chain acyl-CoA synthetase
LQPRPISTACAFVLAKTWNLCARLCVGLRVTGQTHLPRDGAYVLSPNHQSYLDPFLLVGTLPYRTFRRLFFVGASEYFATPLLKRIARLINVVPVDPDANLVRSMQAGAFGLRHGKVLVLFPEGERSPDGTVRMFKKGAAILATHLGVPIVPVAIHGVHEIWPRGRTLRWSQLLPVAGARARVSYGSPVSPARTAGAQDPDRYARLTARLRDAVGDLWATLDRHAGGSSPEEPSSPFT